jgi:hypothetical protein
MSTSSSVNVTPTTALRSSLMDVINSAFKSPLGDANRNAASDDSGSGSFAETPIFTATHESNENVGSTGTPPLRRTAGVVKGAVPLASSPLAIDGTRQLQQLQQKEQVAKRSTGKRHAAGASPMPPASGGRRRQQRGMLFQVSLDIMAEEETGDEGDEEEAENENEDEDVSGEEDSGEEEGGDSEAGEGSVGEEDQSEGSDQESEAELREGAEAYRAEEQHVAASSHDEARLEEEHNVSGETEDARMADEHDSSRQLETPLRLAEHTPFGTPDVVPKPTATPPASIRLWDRSMGGPRPDLCFSTSKRNLVCGK